MIPILPRREFYLPGGWGDLPKAAQLGTAARGYHRLPLLFPNWKGPPKPLEYAIANEDPQTR